MLVLELGYNKPLSWNRYISLHATTQVAYYSYLSVLNKYRHTKEYGGVLDNPYYLQVFHTNEDGVVLGNAIQDSQHEIHLRKSRMRLTFKYFPAISSQS